MKQAPNAEFVACADVYLKNAESAREWAGGSAKVFQDFRKLLELKEVDAVLVATPDHWHAAAAILALNAAKDVYVEKPFSYSIYEGQRMVKAAKAHPKQILCPGTQQRSATHFPEVAAIVQGGKLGEVRYVRVWNFSNMFPNGIGNDPDSQAPEGLDWDMYLGPARKVPFHKKRFGPSYRWFQDYAGGTITDFGTHRFDTVHQIMGVEKPTAVSASGGRFSIKDAGDQPDLMQVTYDYPGWVMSYEACNISAHGLGGRTPGMKYYNARGEMDRPNGMAFYGTSGAIFVDRVGYEIYPDNGRIERVWKNTTDATSLHAKHFVECVRERKTPRATPETGHRATIIAHLGNIALKVGKKLKWDPEKEDFLGAPEASRLLRREARKGWDWV